MKFNILRKDGWQLNPNDKVVGAILNGLVRCDGVCPCHQSEEIPVEDRKCPCKAYRENDHCCCNLYMREN